MLRYCLSSGCDVNAKNRYGETPLHQACMRRHLEMCVFLLDSGAKVCCFVWGFAIMVVHVRVIRFIFFVCCRLVVH